MQQIGTALESGWLKRSYPSRRNSLSWLPEMNPARSPPFLWQRINILTAFWILLWFLRGFSKSKEKKAREIAERTVNVLKGSGIFCVEMFLTTNGEILINEIAPRPHNSGHYSIEGCSISQFEQHIRAILNLPLPKPRLSSPTVMVNILGPTGFEGEYYLDGLHELLSIEGLKLHLYGKRISKPRRKLGHVTITAQLPLGCN